MAKLYIIGEEDGGVLLVKTDPVMLTHISKDTISAYATSHGMTFDGVLGKIAAGAKAIINKTTTGDSFPDLDTSYDAVAKIVGAGTAMSDVRFCFVADIDDADWATSRTVVAPISQALGHLNPPSSPEDFVQLRDAPLD